MSAATIERRLEEMIVLVGVSETGAIAGTVGYQQVSDHEGHIRGMAVSPDHLGTGVAATLLEAVEAGLRDRGCALVSLDTTAPLERAIEFYERHGFRFSGTVRDVFGMPLFEYTKQLQDEK